ncbi:alpha/beta fold hydrolase [Castellaniella sp. S9]|uniref:alpha/beta fold hydrolase n=1 Tax=Castellaniella sp. S9 TaxID=2993652 RepID=UPI0022B5DB7F|nr:alpha/beta fold hydrolase [Castellaniella sp. S9]
MQFVEVQGTRVSYEVDGEGPGLVLVAGTGGNLQSNWGHLVAPLAAGRKVVRPDYSGSGETTDPPGDLSVELLAAQVVAAAEAAGAAPFDLVGFSLGACVSAYIAAEHPDLVRSVTLLAGFPTGRDARLGLQSELWLDLIRHDPHGFAKMILLTGFSPAFLAGMERDVMNQWLDAIIVSNRWEGIARQIQLDGRLDIRPQLPRIKAPTLVIGCTQDYMVPKAHAKALADAVPGARYAELDCGHLAPFERAEEFLGMVLGFVGGDSF